MLETEKTSNQKTKDGQSVILESLYLMDERNRQRMEQIADRLAEMEDRMDEYEREQAVFYTECRKQFAQIMGKAAEVQKEIAGDTKKLKKQITQKQNHIVNNMEVMNDSLKKMIQNIVCLDDANRLIIAKMLLQDMGE